MFTSRHPRTARGHFGRRIGAALTALTLGGAFALAGAGSASAAPSPDYVSWAQAQFLSGSVLGANLDTVASVEPAEAWNTGDDPTMTVKDPLSVKALQAVEVGNGDSVQVNTAGVQAGVLGQFASAAADARSYAAAGAVVDDGAVGVGADVALPGADATISLSGILGSQFAANLVDLDLAIKAIAAEAEAVGENATGDYRLAGAVLELRSPAVSQLTDKVNAALDSISGSLGLLDGQDGAIVADLNKLLLGIDPTLNLLGANANVTATIDIGDLKKLVQDLLTAQYGESGVTFNLETGVVSIDLATAVGGNLNNLPVNTELLSSGVINDILATVTHKVSTIADQVVDRVRAALHDATVTIHAKVDLDVAQAPLVRQVCETVQSVVQVPTQVLTYVTIQVPVVDGVVAQVLNGVPVVNGVPIVGNQVGGLLGGILGGGHTVTWITQTVEKFVTQNVATTVDELVCQNNVTALPALKTSTTIDLSGTVDEFIDGVGVDASAKVKLLGIVNTELNLDLATDAIGDGLALDLFGSDGTVSDLTEALNLGLVTPAVDGLLDGDNAVGLALSDLLSIRVNVQELNDGTFTETAMRITALGGLGNAVGGVSILGAAAGDGSLAQINLAAASVGPNVLNVEDPCVVDCGVGGETVTPPVFGAPGSGGLLAMTGVSIALLIAIVLALLAAGAYLVREGYRNRHAATTAE